MFLPQWSFELITGVCQNPNIRSWPCAFTCNDERRPNLWISIIKSFANGPHLWQTAWTRFTWAIYSREIEVVIYCDAKCFPNPPSVSNMSWKKHLWIPNTLLLSKTTAWGKYPLNHLYVYQCCPKFCKIFGSIFEFLQTTHLALAYIFNLKCSLNVSFGVWLVVFHCPYNSWFSMLPALFLYCNHVRILLWCLHYEFSGCLSFFVMMSGPKVS